MPEDLRRRLGDALGDEEDVVLAYLYGSHAQGTATERSDVDVGVLLDEGPNGLDRVLELNASVADALALPDERVDVKVLNDAGLRLLHQVVAYGEAVVAPDEDARAAFEADVMDRYFDFKPMMERMAEARRDRFRERAG